MKKSGPISRSQKTSAVKSKTVSTRRSSTSKITRSVKNYGKKSLRAVLLSHTFHTGFRVVALAFLVVVPFYGVYAYIEKTVANEIVISKSQILDRVAKHIALPKDSPLAVVRVQDADSLKKQNSFYDQVKSGDYIIMYKTLAIIYDLRNDSVLATKNITEQTR